MVNSRYDRGRKFEGVVRADLTVNGYDVIRSAGSKTKVDLVAFKTGQILLVQCKLDGRCPPNERAELSRIAALMPYGVAVPLIAWKERGSVVVHYLRILTDGSRAPWTPDLVDEATP